MVCTLQVIAQLHSHSTHSRPFSPLLTLTLFHPSAMEVQLWNNLESSGIKYFTGFSYCLGDEKIFMRKKICAERKQTLIDIDEGKDVDDGHDVEETEDKSDEVYVLEGVLVPYPQPQDLAAVLLPHQDEAVLHDPQQNGDLDENEPLVDVAEADLAGSLGGPVQVDEQEVEGGQDPEPAGDVLPRHEEADQRQAGHQGCQLQRKARELPIMA